MHRVARSSRVRRPASQAPTLSAEDAVKEVQKNIRALVSLQNEIDCKQAAYDGAVARTLEFMQKYKIDIVVEGGVAAEVYTSPGKATTVVDLRKLYDSLDLKVFLQCVSASVTKMKEHMSEKEIASVSTSVPGVKGSPTLKLRTRKSGEV